MHPIELDANLKLAKTHLRSGRLNEAEALYARCLKADPACAEALHFLGLSLMHRGRLDQALDLVNRSLSLQPLRADYHNNLATVLGRMNKAPEALGAAQRPSTSARTSPKPTATRASRSKSSAASTKPPKPTAKRSP